MMRPLLCQPFRLGVTLCLLAIALAVVLTPSPAVGQAATTFGSASGVTCPGGNVICNGSINFLTQELFFEPETPPQGLKDTLVTWNEVEYLLDNPYVTGGNGNAAVIGNACRDGSGPQPINEQGFPSYCTAPANAAATIFTNNVRRPAFGVTHPVAASQNGAQTAVAGLPPLRVHPINYNAPNGNEQRVLNPNFGGNGSFNNTGVCYTTGASCTPPNSVISVSAGSSRLDPNETPELDYNVSYGAKPFYCQTNPEPVPLNAPFNTAFDSENYTACGSDPGEPGASMPWITSNGLRSGTPFLVNICCEDNLGLPTAGAATSSWYSVPAVPAANAAVAVLRQIRARALCPADNQACENGGTPSGASFPIQSTERLVDPGTRGVIQPLNPVTGVGGLKKPTLRSADVGGTGLAPNYVWNSAGAATATRKDPTGGDIQFSNENDYYGLFNHLQPNAAYNAGVTAANFYARKQDARLEAARLGKALFWDMQVGSDGVQSCGSCHAHAGADNRTKNQINPNGQDGLRGAPTNFAGAPNSTFDPYPANTDLVQANFPLHKLYDPEVAGDPVCNPAIHGNTTGFTFPDGDPQQNPFPTLGGGDYVACDAANVASDTEEVVSSMGVHFGTFYDIPGGTGAGLGCAAGTATCPFGPPSTGGVRALIRDLRAFGNASDSVDPIAGFQDAGVPGGNPSTLGPGATATTLIPSFRRVEPRNTPTLFLAQFNFDNFWDGRARHDDNGGSVFGPSDPQSHVYVSMQGAGNDLVATRQLIKFTSIASLAKGPALSKFEMSFDGRNWTKIGKKLLQMGVTPLANQLVDPTDSLLGPYSNQNGSACASLQASDRSPEGGPATALGAGVPGLCITYSALIRHAFYPQLWRNQGSHLNGCYTDGRADIHPNQCAAGSVAIPVLAGGAVANSAADPFDNYVLQGPVNGAASATDSNQFRQIEANFSLFWGQSINAWASLLVPDDTPFDRFADANPDMGMTTGETGEPLLVLDAPSCSAFPTGYVRDFEHPGCFREVGNFKRDPYNPNDITRPGTPGFPVQNDTVGHPRMSACIQQLTFNGETGTRICTRYVPAGGTRAPNDPDPLLGLDMFFGSNLSLKNPEFRSARCGACHNAPALTDHTTAFTHKWTLVDAAAEFAHDNPLIEPLQEPLSKQRIISAFHLESETNGPGQDAIERKIGNESIVPAALSANGNCTTANCTGYSFPDAITVNSTATAYVIHSDLGIGPVAGAGAPVPFTGFGGTFFDNGVYNIGVRPCVADYAGNITGACEDTGRGNNDAFGWPMSLTALMLKDLGGPAQATGTAIGAQFDPTNNNAGGRADAQPCTPYCATGGLFPLNGQDQLINSGYSDEPSNPQMPGYIAAGASHIPVGDAHPQLDEACGPVGGCVNTLSDVANAEGFPEFAFDPRSHLSEVINNAVASGDATVGGPGIAEQGTWPVVNRASRMGNFKAPQLREVELTGPYFHNGGKLTLRQVVDFYVRGGDFPVTNSTNRDLNLINLNAEIQSNLSEHEKVALVDFLIELTDDRVAREAGPFDHPQLILPLDGTAPESDGTVNRDVMTSACAPSALGPGAGACDGGLFVNIPATGSAGLAVREPNFLGIASSPRLEGAAANCAVPNNQYCH
jgi:cytochrome c peroxidase